MVEFVIVFAAGKVVGRVIRASLKTMLGRRIQLHDSQGLFFSNASDLLGCEGSALITKTGWEVTSLMCPEV